MLCTLGGSRREKQKRREEEEQSRKMEAACVGCACRSNLLTDTKLVPPPVKYRQILILCMHFGLTADRCMELDKVEAERGCPREVDAHARWKPETKTKR